MSDDEIILGPIDFGETPFPNREPLYGPKGTPADTRPTYSDLERELTDLKRRYGNMEVYARTISDANAIKDKFEEEATERADALTEVTVQLGATIKALKAALVEAHQDLEQWVQLAEHQRNNMPSPDRNPYCPTEAGVDGTRNLITKLGIVLKDAQ